MLIAIPVIEKDVAREIAVNPSLVMVVDPVESDPELQRFICELKLSTGKTYKVPLSLSELRGRCNVRGA